MRQDYSHYHFTMRQRIWYLAQCLTLFGVVDYLFYRSWWILPLALPVTAVFFRVKRTSCARERRMTLNYQFKDALSALNVALQAGYSVENAVEACTWDLEKLYRDSDDILREFHYIERQMRLSVPVEELFLDLGNRCGVEDISNFASVFAAAKRTGGDMTGILQKAARTLGDKIDVRKEIEATVAGKKSEQMIMSVMPFAIILYMQVTSPGFLEVLYGNTVGVVTMSFCLAVYFFAYWMGRRIVDIEV